MFTPAIQKLLKRRALLKQEIEREQKAPSPDWLKVHRLKKWRLALKDALQRMAFTAPLALPYGPGQDMIPAYIPPPTPAPARSRRPPRTRRRQPA